MSDFGPRGEYGRIKPRPYRRGGLDRERRLQVTMGVGAAIVLLLGLGIGFAIGRATAPEPAPAPVAQVETTLPVEATGTLDGMTTLEDTLTAEATSSAETTVADTTRPPAPKQLAPANGAVIAAPRVTLRWSKVKDDGGLPVTYAFEIQNRSAGGTYGGTQIIKGLKSTSYSARVLQVHRRWRVWSVDDAGNASKKSPWRTYVHKYVAPKKSTNASSTATSGTTQ